MGTRQLGLLQPPPSGERRQGRAKDAAENGRADARLHMYREPGPHDIQRVGQDDCRDTGG